MSESGWQRYLREKNIVWELGLQIGWGNIIQLAVECWDQYVEHRHGIKGHGRDWLISAGKVAAEEKAEEARGE